MKRIGSFFLVTVLMFVAAQTPTAADFNLQEGKPYG